MPINRLRFLSERAVPTVLHVDESDNRTIGERARQLAKDGLTGIADFKRLLGLASSEQAAKEKRLWVLHRPGRPATLFDPEQAATMFLEELLSCFPERPTQLVVGFPPLGEPWERYYRQSMKRVCEALGLREPIFFAEPFAVFQFYRYRQRAASPKGAASTVMILDIGGSTSDCCVIRTAADGRIAQAGVHSRPLGVRSVPNAGRALDETILETLLTKLRRQQLHFSDDPVARAREKGGLFPVEEAKIHLCENPTVPAQTVTFPLGSLHQNQRVTAELERSDLERAIRTWWDKHIGKVVTQAHTDARERLADGIQSYDQILLAGGSSVLPGLDDHLHRTLPGEIRKDAVRIGTNAPAAVAYGLAVEAAQRLERYSALGTERLTSAFLGNVFLSVGKSQRELKPCNALPDGTVEPVLSRSTPFAEVFESKCVLPLRPAGSLAFAFTTSLDEPFDRRLNRSSYVVKIPHGEWHTNAVLRLKVKDDEVNATLLLHHGDETSEVGFDPFYLDEERPVSGHKILGVDFGSSNTYVAEFICEAPKPIGQLPEYKITPGVRKLVQEFEQDWLARCSRDPEGTRRAVQWQCQLQKFNFIFHSNKIEGSPLDAGQTQAALQTVPGDTITEPEREVVNLQKAFDFVVESNEAVGDDVSAFARQVNRYLMDGMRSAPGKFRECAVALKGRAMVPPTAGDIPRLMKGLSDEFLDAKETSALVKAVYAHTKFVTIHPFEDGNGRTARLLLAAFMLSSGLPVVVLNSSDRERYFEGLAAADKGNLDELMTLFLELAREAVECLDEPPATETARSPVPPPPGDNARQVRQSSRPPPGAAVAPLSAGVIKRLAAARGKHEATLSVRHRQWLSHYQYFVEQLVLAAGEFDSTEEIQRAGVSLRARKMDEPSEEKFDELCTRKAAASTWFAMLTLETLQEIVRFAFQFERVSERARVALPRPLPVSLRIATSVGDSSFQRPASDPVGIVEVVALQDKLAFVRDDGSVGDLSPKEEIFRLLETILLAYV